MCNCAAGVSCIISKAGELPGTGAEILVLDQTLRLRLVEHNLCVRRGGIALCEPFYQIPQLSND